MVLLSSCCVSPYGTLIIHEFIPYFHQVFSCPGTLIVVPILMSQTTESNHWSKFNIWIHILARYNNIF